MKKEFVFEESGLPDHKQYREATTICHLWLNAHMGKMFNPAQIGNFMKDQPVAAAKLLMERTANPSEASIIVALLGPAKFDMIDHPDNEKGAEYEAMARQTFGVDTVHLIRAIAGLEPDLNPHVTRDKARVFLVEGLSTMHDQLIGRKRIDPHHQVRWDILNNLEKDFSKIKGQNPQIDDLFSKALVKSREALETLDRAATEKPRKPKPPQ